MTSFSDIITYTRPSSAWRYNEFGIYEQVPANQPRFDYDPVTLALRGLLVEEQRTNLLLRSSEFGNASWSKTRMSVVEDVAIAPDGTTSMDLLVPTTVSGNHQISQSVAVSGGSINALSFYVKAAGYNFVRLRIGDSVGYLVDAIADLANGVITNPSAASKIEPIGNGIYRLSMSATASVGATTLSLGVWVYDNSKAAEFVGDGVSGIYVWGAQIEAGAFPTSIIPTTSAQVTRAADVASVNTLSPWFNPDEGTILAELIPISAASSGILSLMSGQFNRLGLYRQQTKLLRWWNSPGTPSGSNEPGGVSAPDGVVAKAAIAYTADGNRAFSANGSAPAISSVVNGPDFSAFSTLGIMRSFGTTTEIMSGHIRRIRYWPRRLSDSELQRITA